MTAVAELDDRSRPGGDDSASGHRWSQRPAGIDPKRPVGRFIVLYQSMRPQPFGAMGTSHRMVQHVLRGLAHKWHAPIDIAAASARMDRDADARQRSPIVEAKTRLYRATMVELSIRIFVQIRRFGARSIASARACARPGCRRANACDCDGVAGDPQRDDPQIANDNFPPFRPNTTVRDKRPIRTLLPLTRCLLQIPGSRNRKSSTLEIF